MASKRKFREAKTAEDEKQMLDNAVPSSTRSVTKWAVKIFREWQEARGNKKCLEEQIGFKVDISKIEDLGSDVADMNAESLNFWLTKFVEEVCKDTGERYPSRTLYGICCGISRHVEDCNGSDAVKILNKTDQRLSTFRRALDAQMRESNAEGVNLKTKKPEREGISEEDEKILWAKNLLGCSTAQSLLHTIYFYNDKLFGIRAKEHRDLRYNNFKVVDCKSVIYDESVTKTYHGGLKDLKYSSRVVKHVCCSDKCVNHFPCLAKCYALYLEKIKVIAEEVEAFYFRPNPNKDIFKYQRMAVGINTLNKILPDKLCREGGLTRKTSHNLRVACASRLFQEGVEEKLIRERTGHRSNALFNYEKISAEQEAEVSKILGPPEGISRNKEVEASPVVSETDSLIPPDVEFEVPDDVLCNIPLPDDHIYVRETLTRSVFNNCTFNFAEK